MRKLNCLIVYLLGVILLTFQASGTEVSGMEIIVKNGNKSGFVRCEKGISTLTSQLYDCLKTKKIVDVEGSDFVIHNRGKIVLKNDQKISDFQITSKDGRIGLIPKYTVMSFFNPDVNFDFSLGNLDHVLNVVKGCRDYYNLFLEKKSDGNHDEAYNAYGTILYVLNKIVTMQINLDPKKNLIGSIAGCVGLGDTMNSDVIATYKDSTHKRAITDGCLHKTFNMDTRSLKEWDDYLKHKIIAHMYNFFLTAEFIKLLCTMCKK